MSFTLMPTHCKVKRAILMDAHYENENEQLFKNPHPVR